MRMPRLTPAALWFGLALLACACSPARQGGDLLVTLLADGSERSILLPASTSVSSLLSQVDVDLGPLDRIEPPLTAMLLDGMRVTIVRVLEEERCERRAIPFQQVGPVAFAGGAQRVQAGLPGEEERCYQVRFEDGIERERVETGRVIIREARDEIWREDLQTQVEPLAFAGTLVWLSDGNAWLARGDSGQLRQLTRDGRLDGRVMALSSDGRRLLFTQELADGRGAALSNALWLMPDLDAPADVLRLLPENVLHAAWMPGSAIEFAWTDSAANNRVSLVRIDPDTGEFLSFRELSAPQPGGGARTGVAGFNWSGDGSHLAWAQGDSIGIMDRSGDAVKVLSGATGLQSASTPCVGQAPVWSPDGRFIVAGLPAGTDTPSSLSVLDLQGEWRVPLATEVGPCPAPAWAPLRDSGLLAHLRARDLDRPTSRAGQDLIILDRDGSNERTLFPEAGQPGLEAQQVVWSVDGRMLAFTWQEQLWLVDVASGEASPFPFAGSVTGIEWAG